MYSKNAWSRPRDYSIYAQKSRRSKWPLLVIVPAFAAGAWFVLPKHEPVSASSVDSAQSVAVTKSEAEATSEIPDTPAAAQQPLADAHYTELQGLVEGWVKKQPKSQQWSVVVQDVTSDANRVAVNDRSSYYMASIYKLFLTLPLSQKYPLQTWAMTSVKTDAGNRQMNNCVDLMISRSDNPCGEGIGKMVGWVSATKAAKARGMTDTSLSSGDMRTSARDVATYMLGLEQGKWFDTQTQQSLLGSMSRQKLRTGIPAGCSGCSVWNKTGDLSNVKHDSAIVEVGKSKFVLVVMSNGGSFTQIADVTRLVANTLR